MISILPETPDQHATAIEALYDQSFGPGHFAKTAERLREYNTSLPEISRVAIRDDRLIAVARAWPIMIETGGPALFVGPVAVSADYRGVRLGLSVTGEVLEAGRLAGWSMAVLIGAPNYFGELGFKVSDEGRFCFPGPQDQARVMTIDLAGDSSLYRGCIIAA